MATHIKTLIEEFFKRSKKSLHVKEKIEKILKNNLDQETQKHVEVKEVSKTQVVFSVDSSSAAYNFNLCKKRISKEIKEEFKEEKKIKVRIG